MLPRVKKNYLVRTTYYLVRTTYYVVRTRYFFYTWQHYASVFDKPPVLIYSTIPRRACVYVTEKKSHLRKIYADLKDQKMRLLSCYHGRYGGI